MFALAALLWTTPVSADETCGGVEQGVVLDLSSVWEKVPGVPDLSGLSTDALKARAAEVERRAEGIAPYVMPYVAAMDLRAGQNIGLLVQLGDHAAKTSPYNHAADFGWSPPDWDKIPVEQAKVFRAMTAELIEQMREDLRAGRVSSPLDAGDLSSETTIEGVTAILRMNQALLDAGIPIDFAGHSPMSVEDVRGLQLVARGEFPSDTENHKAARYSLQAATDHLGDGKVEALMNHWRAGTVPRGAKGLGVPAAAAKASLDALDKLARERQAINEALKDRGEDPAATPTLDAIQHEFQALDSLVARAGFEVQKRLWGFPETYELVVGLDGKTTIEKLPTELYRQSAVLGQGSRGLERIPLGGTDSEILWTNKVGASDLSFTPQELDWLVRVKDSQELLQGNTSGFGIADIPMPASLAAKLGLKPPELAKQNPLLPSQRINLGPFGPQLSNSEKIDRIALQPVESRYEYANWVRGDLFRQTLRAQGNTWVNEQLDNTWLNRTVEVLDVFNYPFKGKDPMNWIGPRTELMKWRSQHFGGNAETALDNAFQALLNRNFSPAMTLMREANGQTELHNHYNGIYTEKVEQTQTDTVLFVAALPLSAFGVAEGAVGMSRHIAKMRHLKHSSRLVNKSGTLLSRVRYADDVAGLADDFVRIDGKGLIHRPTPLEDDFVKAWRAKYPTGQVNEAVVRQHFRNGFRFDDAKRLTRFSGDDYFKLRQREVKALRESDLFKSDLRARGVSDQRIQWMETKQSPLSFENPKQYEAFKADLQKTLKRAGLDDSTVTLKGTSTTFYSENPGKPLGHHFDANAGELADIDLGLTSKKMVDTMEAAGHTAHPKIKTIFKTRHTVSEYPELAEFAAKWEGILGREVNFVGLTDSALPKIDPTEFVLVGKIAK